MNLMSDISKHTHR